MLTQRNSNHRQALARQGFNENGKIVHHDGRQGNWYEYVEKGGDTRNTGQK